MRGVVALLVAGFLFVSISVLYPDVRSQETVGNTLYVGGSGPGNYSSIQNAIDNASEGDTIFVYNGTYYENIVVNKTVNLVGENKETTIVDGGGWFQVGYVFNVKAKQVNITGFTIKNSTTNSYTSGSFDPGYGILIYANNSKIVGNIIKENAIGIYLENSFDNKIFTNIIKNNGEGIGSFNSSGNTMDGNEIIGHELIIGRSYGISMYIASNNVITNNTISNNSGDGIQLSYFCENNSIYYNNFINNRENANDSGNNNSWDNGQYGNYWDNYTGNDKNNDGIGDTPYNIPGGNNQDKYPLMMPYDGTIRLKEFYIDQGSVFTMLIIGMIIAIIFLVPIAYIWYKKGWR